MAKIDRGNHPQGMPWAPPTSRIVAATLALYWTALCIGTHLPGKLVAANVLVVSDKTLHFWAYTGLSFLIATLLFCLGMPVGRAGWSALIIAVVYGALDELGQIFIPGRTAELADWLASSTTALSRLSSKA